MKIVTVIGARPQFIKASAVCPLVRQWHTEILVHTGQHYDAGMSTVFFRELGIPEPAVNLGVGSGSHGEQTGRMLAGLEKVLAVERPDWVLIYGDTNSTLAGALAAAKLDLPVAHVEAGLRSFKRKMPEEINRVVADHLARLLFCPSETAARNLAAEGITRGVHVVGDVMADAVARAADQSARASTVLARLGLKSGQYLLATVHRAENTDDPARLDAILEALHALREPVVFPVHPRTVKSLKPQRLQGNSHVRFIEPVGYLDMVQLERSARLILTDSGGVQKEA